MIDPRLLIHRVLHYVLPLSLSIRHVLSKDGYERLLVRYQQVFLQQLKAFPDGVPYRLISRQSVADNTFAYQLQAPPGVLHHGGNTLLVRWRNSNAEAADLMAVCGWQPHEKVKVRTASSSFRPGRLIETDLATALRDHVDIRKVSASLLRWLRVDRAATVNITLPALIQQSGRGPQLLAQTFLQWQPGMSPRSYSITAIHSSLQGETVEILVSHVTEQRQGAAGNPQTLAGRCCGYLDSLTPGQDTLYAWPLPFPLTLSLENRTDQQPLLVVATGIAAAGPLLELDLEKPQRPVWLVVGLRDFDPQQPYLKQVLDFARRHPDVRMDIALSRHDGPADPAGLPANCHWHGHSRVQQVMQRELERFTRHFSARGDMMVIGHTSMGESIKLWLKNFLVANFVASGDSDADRRIRQMERELRLQYSLSGR